MANSRARDRRLEKSALDLLFQRADSRWEEGNLRSAFRLFLAGAKAGDSGAQINLGNFYCDGTGLKPNRVRALYWYRRAYQQGDRAGANNIGVIFRSEGKLQRALVWFERAVKLNDTDANLEIAKIYLRGNRREDAVSRLRLVYNARPYDVCEASREEAAGLLRDLGAI